MLRRGLNLAAIASSLDVSRQTLWRWRSAGAAHASRPGTLTGDQQRMIADWVCDHPTATQSHATDWWRSLHLHPSSVSQSTVCRALKHCGISYKKAVKSYTERDPLHVADWLSSMSHLPRGSVMALDEASFSLNHTQAYAYGRRGQRVVIPRPGRRGARYSLLVCADRRGVLRYELHPGSITGRLFQDFLSALPAVQGRSLVMDNAVIHHSKRILSGVARLAGDRNLSLRYLPPYCPELNPVELVFNALRTHVRQRAPRGPGPQGPDPYGDWLRRNARMFRSAKADCWNLDQLFKEPVTRPDVTARHEANKHLDFLVVKCSYKW
ncbi:g612 [Coccomyxa elongata]